MHPYTKKLIAPVTVTVLVILAYLGYLILAVSYGMPSWMQVLVSVVAVIMICAMVYVCFTRYKEIMSGEEDDLDRY